MSQNCEKSNDFELLLVKDKQDFWEVIGITYSNAMRVEPDCSTLRASLLTIEECKKQLNAGQKILISKHLQYPEALPTDLVIAKIDEVENKRRIAINDISARLQQLLISIQILDLMEYLNNYVKLLNAGYFITDSNREDKYFELIEDTQKYEEPIKPAPQASYEEELAYTEAKKKYDTAQYNLQTLEKYLNSYDRLSKIKDITDFLIETRDKINQAESEEEISKIMEIYNANVKNYQLLK